MKKNVDTTKEIIADMKKSYEFSSRGIDIIELEDSVQLCTKADMYEYLIKIAKTPRKYIMTDSLLETLSIVAYKQPVTKGEIEAVRGIRCDRVLEGLIAKNLVTIVGRAESVGRPNLYGTTNEFLKQFEFESLKDLPKIEDLEGVIFEAEEPPVFADGPAELGSKTCLKLTPTDRSCRGFYC